MNVDKNFPISFNGKAVNSARSVLPCALLLAQIAERILILTMQLLQQINLFIAPTAMPYTIHIAAIVGRMSG